MKKLLTILLLFTYLSVSGQLSGTNETFFKRFPEPAKVILTYTGAVILNAVGDGLNDNGIKGWGHVSNAASIGVLLASPFILDYDKSKWYYYLITYTALRISFFDYTYNATRGLPLEYIGGTSFWDKGLQKLNPPGTYMFRGVSLIVGISIPIQEFGVRKHFNKNKIFSSENFF